MTFAPSRIPAHSAVTAVYGGVGLVKQARDAARSHVLVATPGRLEDLLARSAFTLDKVQMLVLDEADRMLDIGFRPAIDRIVALCPTTRQTLFFSATLDGDAGRLAKEYTRQPVVHERGPTARRASTDVEHRFLQVSHEYRIEALVGELQRDRELALVFVRTKRGADRLVRRLQVSRGRKPSRCTETSHSASASRRSHDSRAGRSTRSSPRMWRPAGLTSAESRT